jgi:hypothetical protein
MSDMAQESSLLATIVPDFEEVFLKFSPISSILKKQTNIDLATQKYDLVIADF